MSEERMAILRMIADKKITAEEGAQLLEALNEQRTERATGGQADSHSDQQQRYEYRYHYNYKHPHEKKEQRDQQRQARDENKRSRRRERDQHRQSHREARHRHRDQSRQNRERWRSERQAHWQDKLDDLSRMFEGVFGKEGIFGKGGVFGQGCGFTPYTDTSDDAPVQDTEYTIEEGTGLYIVNTSGDLIVRGVEGDQLRMIVPDNRGPGVAPPMAHHDPASKQVQITSANQNIIVEAPWQVTNLHITHIDGNVRLIDLSADVQVTANDGNLSAQDITGAFRGTTNDSNVTIKDLHSSDVDMTINDGSALVGMDVPTEGSVKMVSANAPISLSLPDASAFDLTARVSGGRITTNLTDASDIGDKLELSHNGGGASIYLEAQSGNIDVRVIDTGATERIEEEDKKKKKKKKK